MTQRSTTDRPILALESWTDRIWFVAIHVVMFALLLTAGSAHAASRVKDVAGFEGVRDNVLVGYGLVVGLKGTGDDLRRFEEDRCHQAKLARHVGTLRDQHPRRPSRNR